MTVIFIYNPRQKSWHACPVLQRLSRKFISSSPTPPPPPNQCYLSWWIRHWSFPTLSGGEGGSYSSDVITDCLKNSLSTHFHAIWFRRAKNFCRGLYLYLRKNGTITKANCPCWIVIELKLLCILRYFWHDFIGLRSCKWINSDRVGKTTSM